MWGKEKQTSIHTPAPAYFVWLADNAHHEDPQGPLVTGAAKLSSFVQQFQKLLDKTEPLEPEKIERFGILLCIFLLIGIYYREEKPCSILVFFAIQKVFFPTDL